MISDNVETPDRQFFFFSSFSSYLFSWTHRGLTLPQWRGKIPSVSLSKSCVCSILLQLLFKKGVLQVSLVNKPEASPLCRFAPNRAEISICTHALNLAPSWRKCTFLAKLPWENSLWLTHWICLRRGRSESAGDQTVLGNAFDILQNKSQMTSVVIMLKPFLISLSSKVSYIQPYTQIEVLKQLDIGWEPGMAQWLSYL